MPDEQDFDVNDSIDNTAFTGAMKIYRRKEYNPQ